MSTLKKFLVRIGLAGLSSTQKVDKGRNHVVKITDNPTYPTLQVQMPDLAEACNKLEASVLEVQFNGGKIAYDRKNVHEAQLDELIKYLSEQVQVISMGDRSKILSAGFDVRRSNAPITHLEAPQNLRATMSNFRGMIDLRWQPVYGSRYSQVWMTKGDPLLEEGWEMVGISSTSRFTVENLETGRFYNFRVVAVGARTHSGLSDIAMSMAA